MSNQREVKNICLIKGAVYPLQTYGWSGIQLGASQEEVNGKMPTDAPPMSITSQPPGAFADSDTNWQLTFGASHDSVLGLFSGKKFAEQIALISLKKDSVYRRSIGNIDFHIYDLVDGQQQLDFVVANDSANAAIGRFETNFDDCKEIRSISMRAPLMCIGWGRTIGMLPTDPDPVKPRDNDEEHKLARETWKLGPIDMRWDENRGVWGAWNDLIADHNKENLGTLVFDTNPDDKCGFPFLKGKLEDVWKIVIDSAQNPTGVENDTDKSGAVTTHLGHRWSSKGEEPGVWLHAPLSSTFIIHRGDTSTGKCGSEIYEEAPQIEIRTSTFFHLNNEFDGPICFTQTDINPKKDCVGCMKFDGAQWVPVIEFNACDKVGTELGVLFANDQVLAGHIIGVCQLLLECLGKADKGVDPEKARQAAASSATASGSAAGAEAALDGLPSGSGPGGDFVAGDTLQSGGEPLTAGEASSLNDSIPAASEAYENSSNKQQAAADAANTAADAIDASNEAGNKLSESTAAANETQAAADAANAKLAEQPNDGSTKEAAAKANEANAEAAADRNQDQADYNEANEATDKAIQDAKDADGEANAAAKEAAEKGDQVTEDANGKLPKDVQDAMDKADADAEQARKDREAAGLHEDDPEPTASDAGEEALEQACDKIDGMACKAAEDAIAMGQAMGEMVQKAMSDMAGLMNGAFGELTASINNGPLGSTLGFDPETGTGGLAPPDVETPPACPADAGGSGKPAPEGVAGGPLVDEGGFTGPGTTTDGPPGTPTVVPKPKKPITSKPRPPAGPGTTGGATEAPPPGLGPPTTTRPPPVPPPPPPTCPIITIKDPCGGESTHGPDTGGKGSGTPQGTPAPGAGGPGTPEGAATGGVDGATGEVFKPSAGGGTFGLGGQNTGNVF